MEKHSRWLSHPIDRAISSLGGKHKSVTMDKDAPYNHVVELYNKTRRPCGSYLSDKDLESLKIRASEMDLETGKPADSGPQFGTPCPSDEVDKLFEKVSNDFRNLEDANVYHTGYGVALAIKKSFDEMEIFDFGGERKPICAYYAREKRSSSPVELRLGFVPVLSDTEPEFSTSLIFEAYDKHIPHRGCILFDGAVSNEQLRRSEVYCADLLMGQKMHWTKKPPGTHFPVFIYSISGSQGRVIQAHYENLHFIIRKTKHFPFEEGSASGYKTMVRWMLNTPTGDILMLRKSAKDRVHHIVKALKTPFTGGK